MLTISHSVFLLVNQLVMINISSAENRFELRDDPDLFIDVLQQRSPPVLWLLTLLTVLAPLLQGVSVSEVSLGVDIVQAGLLHHQLPVHQLDVLEEGETFLPLPPRDLLALNAASSRDWSCAMQTHTFRVKSLFAGGVGGGANYDLRRDINSLSDTFNIGK